MVAFSSSMLDRFGAHELSKLTTCGAKELEEWPDYLSAAIWNFMVGLMHPDPAVLHLDLTFLRRATAAAKEYRLARVHLLQYVEGVATVPRQHRLVSYLLALTHFEQCVGAVWQAAELFNRIEHRVTGLPANSKLTVFKKNEWTDLARINLLNNTSKHFNADQAEKTSTPVWITNKALKCADRELTFDELYENLVALSEAARQTFVEIPKEFHARCERVKTSQQ